THDELQGRFDLGADRLRRPEVGGGEDGAQHGANVAVGLLPRGDRGIDAPIRRLIGDEARTEFGADVMHRCVLFGEELEQPDALVLAIILEGEPKDVFHATIVGPVAKDEPRARIVSSIYEGSRKRSAPLPTKTLK